MSKKSLKIMLRFNMVLLPLCKVSRTYSVTNSSSSGCTFFIVVHPGSGLLRVHLSSEYTSPARPCKAPHA